MSFPIYALDPNNKPVTIQVTADGRLVTTLNPKPATTLPITRQSLIVTSDGKVRVA
ncbi:MAG: hypothetical protein ACK5S6_00385 [bacterium]|jgi:hypothetical protein